MNLKETAQEIRTILEEKRKEMRISFVESKHVYFMMDSMGKIRSNFPSVTKIVNKFHEKFDADTISMKMAKGNLIEQKRLLNEWKLAGSISINMGSRCHYELEKELINRNNNYKKIRQPFFECGEDQTIKSDKMILAGKDYLNLMEQREAILIDTELIMGHSEEEYVGQCDNAWLIMNKNKDNYGIVISDWKSNQPKNFEVQHYTKKMYDPFSELNDIALSHYYLQISLYGRLLLRMLENTKYKDIKFLGGVVILLREEGIYTEYKIPQKVINTVLSINLKPFLK